MMNTNTAKITPIFQNAGITLVEFPKNKTEQKLKKIRSLCH